MRVRSALARHRRRRELWIAAMVLDELSGKLIDRFEREVEVGDDGQALATIELAGTVVEVAALLTKKSDAA